MVATSSFLLRSAFAVALAATLAACGGGGGSTPATATVRFAGTPQTATVSSTQTLVSAQSHPSPSLVVTDGTHTLVINSVSLTLRDIDMERTSQSVDCKDGQNSSHLDCSDWVDGPIRVDLNLSSSSSPGHHLTIPLQIGTYDVISFDISGADGGDPQELAYIDANPDIGTNSVLVKGTFNGQAFEFKTRVTGDREVFLNPPLTVAVDGPVEFQFAVQFDVAQWFRKSNGSLIDPGTTVEDDRETIRQNIRNRIESYSLP